MNGASRRTTTVSAPDPSRSLLSAVLSVSLVLALSLLPMQLEAQETGTIVGTVTHGGTAAGLSGVQVSLPDLNIGTISDAEGNFTIDDVPVGEHLIRVRLIGFTASQQSVTVRANQTSRVEFSVRESAVAVDELVVTALGISREEKSLGFATEQLAGDQLAQTGEADLLSAMSGNVAGLKISKVGPAGGSNRVTLRGATSLLGENQPLIIVDGVPVSNMSTDHARTDRDPDPLSSDVDYGNALNDLNMSDVESVNVLKGANAAALYGSRAANGAIVISTKQGATGSSTMQYEADFNYSLQTPLRMPVYQNRYGQGGGGQFEFVDGYGSGVNDGTDESWGPLMDGRMKAQWWTDGESAPWVPRPYNVRDYYQTGFTFQKHVAASVGSEQAHARVSVTDNDQEGLTPNHRIDRTTFTLAGGVNLSDDLRASGRGSFSSRAGRSMPEVGYSGFNPNQTFTWFGRQVDTRRLRDYMDDDGRQRSWNYNYHDNPYWEVYARQSTQDRQRFFGFLSLAYDMTDWLNVQVRSGTDWFNERREHNVPKTKIARQEGFGSFNHTEIVTQEINHDLIATATRQLTESLSLEVIGGANLRKDEQRYNTLDVDRLNVDGVFNVANAATPPTVNEYIGRKEVQSLYSSANLGWNGYLFLDVTGRNDWSSTLPEENNSYFYPSVSTSLVFTELLSDSGLADVLSYGKLRASWARVGSDAEPYQLASVLEALEPPFKGQPGYSISQTIPNADLRPEQTDSWEIGLDLRSANERALLDLTYYRSTTKDQILPVQVSAASGFESQILNAGRIGNEGVEAVLGLTPIRQDQGLSWDLQLNFAKNTNKVEDLYGDLQSIVLGTFWRMSVEARKGETYGTLYGFRNKRDEQGRLLIDSNGLPMREDEPSVLGHYPPDWTGGLRSSLRYDDVLFSFLVDIRQGGELFSVTNQWGKYSGMLAETVEGREDGYVYEGVHEDGTQNTTPVDAQTRWKSQWSIQENNVFDASFIKLREVTFAFDLPDSLLQKVPFGNARLSLVGRNLALLHSNAPHVDPETGFDSGNVQGVEYGQIPSQRSVGLYLSVTP